MLLPTISIVTGVSSIFPMQSRAYSARRRSRILVELLEGAIVVVWCTVLGDNVMQGNPGAFTYWSVTRIASPGGVQAALIQGQHKVLY